MNFVHISCIIILGRGGGGVDSAYETCRGNVIVYKVLIENCVLKSETDKVADKD